MFKVVSLPEAIDNRAVAVETHHPVELGNVVQERDHVVGEVCVRQPDKISEVTCQGHVVVRTNREGES